MKLIRYYGLLLIVVGFSNFSGCEKLDEPLNDNCGIEGTIRMKANDWQGEVVFSKELNTYLVSHVVPNSIDAVYLGVPCKLPREFQQDGKQVKFSGRYRDYPSAPQRFVGTEYYYLELTDIESR